MKEEKLIFDEVGIRIALPFELVIESKRKEALLNDCGCSDNPAITDDYLLEREKTLINGSYVMHICELRLMQKMAEKATENGGDILEVGFGMGLASDAIQSNPNVTSHTIIELHPTIYEKALEWAKDKPNVNIILGDWMNVVPHLTQKFDGIFHDTHIERNIPRFLGNIKHLSKEGTIVCFFVSPNNAKESLNMENFKFTDEEIISSPYFGEKGWDWGWTTFNGTEFTK